MPHDSRVHPGGLRAAPAPARPQVRSLAVTGGKGGVGKTTVAVNLALALADAGRRTLLLDTDLGLANVDVLLGLTPRFTLADVVAGRCSIEETLLEGPKGLLVVPAASGKRHMTELSPAEHVGLIRAFSELDRPLEHLVIDTAAGLGESVLTFSQAAHEIIVVVCNEPASITDAYALIKVLSRERGVARMHVLANMTRSAGEGRELFDKLSRVTDRFLDVQLEFLGAVPHDEWMRRAIQRQQPVLQAFPASASAMALKALAEKVARWPAPSGARGHIEFFVERQVAGAGVAA
ncbi:MAG: cobyrinic acid a,c-diamide synthase [Lysobacteraceae bacterium]|nr:MAG: cobyrinic acid a,c-diamide synthase [Xanthomonadaceae bacterium]